MKELRVIKGFVAQTVLLVILGIFIFPVLGLCQSEEDEKYFLEDRNPWLSSLSSNWENIERSQYYTISKQRLGSMILIVRIDINRNLSTSQAKKISREAASVVTTLFSSKYSRIDYGFTRGMNPTYSRVYILQERNPKPIEKPV